MRDGKRVSPNAAGPWVFRVENVVPCPRGVDTKLMLQAAVANRFAAEHRLQVTAHQLQQLLCELNGGYPVDGLDGSNPGARANQT